MIVKVSKHSSVDIRMKIKDVEYELVEQMFTDEKVKKLERLKD